MILWTLAWRNVLRNGRRSTITVSSIAVGLAALTFLWGFIDGENRQMIENTTRYLAGDAQIHIKGYHEDPTLDLAIVDAQPLLQALRADPDVAAASVRMEGKALASRNDKSRGVVMVGVSPQEEEKVTDLFKAIIDGTTLGADPKGVLIGAKLAESLGVKAGEELVFVGQAYDGSIASARIPVRGVFQTKIDELDGYVAVMPLEAVREFLAAPGGATAIALRLRDRDALEAVQVRLAARLGSDYEVVGWPTLLPMVALSTRYHEVMAYVVLAIFFVLVAAGVANPILMAVLERIREFGIMLAVGTSPAWLLRLVLYEAVILGLLGLLIGNTLGLGVTAFFGKVGINMSAFEAGLRTMPGLEDVLYPAVRVERSLMISVVVFVTACLVALYPAVKAARLEPVAAIRGIAGAPSGGGHGHTGKARRWPVFMLIAARNILRNPRRTAITTGGTAFAIIAYVFLFGFFDGFGEQIIDTSTRYLTGHIQLERAGFRRELAPELALDQADELLERIRRVPNVAAAAPRIQAQALASSAAKSEGIVLIGVDPQAERAVTFIHQTIVQGKALEPGAQREIMIGRKLAEKLNVRLGEKLVVMVQAADGSLATAAYRIGGIFATESSAFDGAIGFVALSTARSLLALGERSSTINIRLADRAKLDQTLDELRRSVSGSEHVFVPWQELLPQIDGMVNLIRVFSYILLLIVFSVAALAVMNTVFMAVAERTREFGVMMALGTSPGAIIRMVVYETLVLMALASVIGYGGGMLLVEYFGRRGIDLSVFFASYSSIPGLTGIIYPKLIVANIAGPGVLLFVASILVSLYPAAKAAQLDPVKAIRHV